MIVADRRLRRGDVRIDLRVLRVKDQAERPDRDGRNLKRGPKPNLQSAICNLQFHDGVAV